MSYLYDGDEMVAEYDAGNTVLRRYVHGRLDDDPLAWYEGAGMSAAGRRYLVADHQGSVAAVTDSAGNAIAEPRALRCLRAGYAPRSFAIAAGSSVRAG